ncbi:MAG: hydroxymethylglutaryl-CoA reductase [Gammaproteobacteria bacterium]
MSQTIIPTRLVGPLKIVFAKKIFEINVPLATYETPLWRSVGRVARLSCLLDGIQTTVLRDVMTRSILLEADSAQTLFDILKDLQRKSENLKELVEKSSKFAKFHSYHAEVIGNLLYLRLAITTGDAAGHNMVTKAAEQVLDWLLKEYPQLKYVSLSGNYCVDKKVSAVNGILGRGKSVVAELTITEELCIKHLRVSPKDIYNLHIKKNLLGSILAGSLRSANAHFANMLLAFYLATGQDAANIVEGSQGITHVELRGNDLYFSVSLPNIIVGTVGNGKDLPFVQENLKTLGCLEKRPIGENSKRLAAIAAATVLCGELSLLAAFCNRGELMRSHEVLERK